MGKLFEKIRDLESGRLSIVRRRYGLITVIQDQLESIQFRPWPKLISIGEVHWLGAWNHQHGSPDCCRLWYNQPLGHSEYLTLSYIQSNWHTSYHTFCEALRVLDRVAAIKRSDAILCEVTNQRISDRLLRRQGWSRHLEGSSKRHWIKRFYGSYPTHAISDRDADIDLREGKAKSVQVLTELGNGLGLPSPSELTNQG